MFLLVNTAILCCVQLHLCCNTSAFNTSNDSIMCLSKYLQYFIENVLHWSTSVALTIIWRVMLNKSGPEGHPVVQLLYWLCSSVVEYNYNNLLQVGAYNQDDVLTCYCTHLSLFGAAVITTSIMVDPFNNVIVFVTEKDTYIPLMIVLILFIVYINLLIWTMLIDKNVKLKVSHIIRFFVLSCIEMFTYLFGVIYWSPSQCSILVTIIAICIAVN